jgi:protein import protein ZIM17
MTDRDSDELGAGVAAESSWHDNREETGLSALISSSPQCSPLQSLSQEAAMGLVLRAAGTGTGWTTGSGLEGPSCSIEGAGSDECLSDMSTGILQQSPRRRMRVAFTCNLCGHRTTRAINPHAYTDGTVFVQVRCLF